MTEKYPDHQTDDAKDGDKPISIADSLTQLTPGSVPGDENRKRDVARTALDDEIEDLRARREAVTEEMGINPNHAPLRHKWTLAHESLQSAIQDKTRPDGAEPVPGPVNEGPGNPSVDQESQ